MITVYTPIGEREIEKLKVGDQIEIDGAIYCGRDAVLPKLVRLIENRGLDRIGVDLEGAVIFHTAVSPAGPEPIIATRSLLAVASDRENPFVSP